MTRWKAAFFGLLAATLLGAAAATYSILDAGVSLSYLRTGYEDAITDLAVLRRLVPAAGGSTKADILTLLRRQNPAAFITSTDSTVQIGQLTFQFRSTGELQSISHLPIFLSGARVAVAAAVGAA